jgi:hypothetical protein
MFVQMASTPRKPRRARHLASFAVAAALLLAAAAPATAQSDDRANSHMSEVSNMTEQVGAGEAEDTMAEASPSGLQKKVVGGLPFTGLDLIALGAVAAALVSMGFALRRLTADQSSR